MEIGRQLFWMIYKPYMNLSCHLFYFKHIVMHPAIEKALRRYTFSVRQFVSLFRACGSNSRMKVVESSSLVHRFSVTRVAVSVSERSIGQRSRSPDVKKINVIRLYSV